MALQGSLPPRFVYHNARPLERCIAIAFQPSQRLRELVEKPLLDRHKLRRAQRGRAPDEFDDDSDAGRAEAGRHARAQGRTGGWRQMLAPKVGP